MAPCRVRSRGVRLVAPCRGRVLIAPRFTQRPRLRALRLRVAPRRTVSHYQPITRLTAAAAAIVKVPVPSIKSIVRRRQTSDWPSLLV